MWNVYGDLLWWSWGRENDIIKGISLHQKCLSVAFSTFPFKIHANLANLSVHMYGVDCRPHNGHWSCYAWQISTNHHVAAVQMCSKVILLLSGQNVSCVLAAQTLTRFIWKRGLWDFELQAHFLKFLFFLSILQLFPHYCLPVWTTFWMRPRFLFLVYYMLH